MVSLCRSLSDLTRLGCRLTEAETSQGLGIIQSALTTFITRSKSDNTLETQAEMCVGLLGNHTQRTQFQFPSNSPHNVPYQKNAISSMMQGSVGHHNSTNQQGTNTIGSTIASPTGGGIIIGGINTSTTGGTNNQQNGTNTINSNGGSGNNNSNVHNLLHPRSPSYYASNQQTTQNGGSSNPNIFNIPTLALDPTTLNKIQQQRDQQQHQIAQQVMAGSPVANPGQFGGGVGSFGRSLF